MEKVKYSLPNILTCISLLFSNLEIYVKILYAFLISSTSEAQYLLVVITILISGDTQKLLSFSLCTYIHFVLTP
jgi:hypothetical protein